MGIRTALLILEDAVKRSQTEDVNTLEVLEALRFLRLHSKVSWPFEQFRESLASIEGELDLDKVGRSQVLNESLNGIKRALAEAK
jgi:hypothetical protein